MHPLSRYEGATHRHRHSRKLNYAHGTARQRGGWRVRGRVRREGGGEGGGQGARGEDEPRERRSGARPGALVARTLDFAEPREPPEEVEPTSHWSATSFCRAVLFVPRRVRGGELGVVDGRRAGGDLGAAKGSH